MKKLYILIAMILCVGGLSAQVIYEEDFESYIDGPELRGTWTLMNGDELDLVTGNDINSESTKMLKGVAPATASNEWDLQIKSPEITVVDGNRYTVSFEIRSDGDGVARISTGAAEQVPNNQYWENVTTGTDWISYTYEYIYGDQNSPIVAGSNILELNFDMGTVAGMTYYIDNVKVTNMGTSTSSIAPKAEAKISTVPGIINVAPQMGSNVEVYSLSGAKVFSQDNAGGNVSVNVAPGLYIVVVDNTSTKVVVK